VFDADVAFAGEDETLASHVAVLEYVDGLKLGDLVADSEPLTATAIAQIAVDLFYLLAELENKQRFHNDLHARKPARPDAALRAEARGRDRSWDPRGRRGSRLDH
jgi:hypothetical protein